MLPHFVSVLATVAVLMIGCTTSISQQTKPQENKPEKPKSVIVPFVYDEDDFGQVVVGKEPKLTAQDVGDGVPVGIAPAHNCFYLEDKRPLPALERGARYFHPARSFICFIPLNDPSVKDFDKAYPELNSSAQEIKKLLRKRPRNFKPKGIPDLPNNNASQSILSRVEYLDFTAGFGILFLTQYSQEMQPNPVNNEELTYNFQGLTKDDKYYIAARFAVTHPSFPKGIDYTDHIERDKNELYLRNAERKLNGLAEQSFQPSLPKLKTLLTSISFQ